jgi:hypothetical protein
VKAPVPYSKRDVIRVPRRAVALPGGSRVPSASGLSAGDDVDVALELGGNPTPQPSVCCIS